MASAQTNWHWEAGEVDELKEHIELRYGNAGETPYEDWIPIARIAKPKNRIFTAEWLVKQNSPECQTMMEDAINQLNFYLADKNEPDPWGYALYHCNTGQTCTLVFIGRTSKAESKAFDNRAKSFSFLLKKLQNYQLRRKSLANLFKVGDSFYI